MSTTRVAFRIVYGTLYFVLCFLLLALLLITPGDSIYQAKDNRQDYNIWIIAVCYVIAVSVVLFVYAWRLYINKTVLASIPKAWIPVDRGDVHTNVYKMVWASLNRSAAIAFEARPRVDNAPVPTMTGAAAGAGPTEDEPLPEAQVAEMHSGSMRRSFQMLRLRKTATVEDELGIALPPHRPVWGDIEHPGWSSPNSPDLPNLQYGTVLSELPHLIEAKALTLAPPDAASQTEPPMLDPEAVALLQRPVSMSLREYLGHLADLGVLPMTSTTSDFLAAYENARFSMQPLSNARFRDLMHLFAEILRAMEPLDPAVLLPLDGADDATNGSDDIDNDAPMATSPTTPRSARSRTPSRSPSSSGSGTGSAASRLRPPMPQRNSSANTWRQYRTAPTTPKSRRAAPSRASSQSSFAQSRHPYPVSQPASSSSSSSSLRSKASSDGSGSVIRLATRSDASELPYVLTLTDTT